MLTKEWQPGQKVQLSDVTRLGVMRLLCEGRGAVDDTPPVTRESVLESMRVGRLEAQEATRASGFDFTTLYDRACIELSRIAGSALV